MLIKSFDLSKISFAASLHIIPISRLPELSAHFPLAPQQSSIVVDSNPRLKSTLAFTL